MLTILRKGATSWVAQIFILLLSMSFAFFGIQGIFRYAGDKPVAVIGDARIETQAFSAEFKREVDRMRRSLGAAFDVNQARQFGLDRQVLQRMITTTLLEQRAHDLGIVADDRSVVERVHAEKAFQGISGFDRVQFETVLRNSNLTEGIYVDLIRREMIRAQLIETFLSAPPAPLALTEPLFRRAREQRIAQYLVIPEKAVGAIAQPSAEQIEAYYKTNEPRFSAPEYRHLSFISASAQSLAATVNVPDEDIQAAYEARKAEFIVPDTREFDQFVITEAEKAKSASAKLAAGGDFAAVALEFAGIKASELSLGATAQADLPSEVAQAAFDAKIGTVVGPTETALGAMFLRPTKAIAGSTKTLDQVKAEIRTKLAQEKAQDALYDLTRKMEDKRAAGDSLASIAQDLSLKIIDIPAIDGQGLDSAGKIVAGLPDDPKFLSDGFSLDAGADSDVIELKGPVFAIIHVEGVTAAAIKPLDKVRAEVIAAWTADERTKRLKQLADDVLSKAKAGGEFSKLAAELHVSVKTSAPLARGKSDGELGSDVINSLFAAAPGNYVSGLAPAGAGQVIARLDRILPVDLVGEAAALRAAKDDLGRAIGSDMIEQYLTLLKAKYDVTINEASLARAIGPSGQ
jgi:peptidyl-prolyl cis-trans isomerase D